MKVMYETPKRPADPLYQIAEGAVICPAQTTRLLITPDEKYATMLIGHNGPNGVQAMVSQDLLRTDMGLVFIDTKSDPVQEVAAMAKKGGPDLLLLRSRQRQQHTLQPADRRRGGGHRRSGDYLPNHEPGQPAILQDPG